MSLQARSHEGSQGYTAHPTRLWRNW
jgi:hypothetical protein